MCTRGPGKLHLPKTYALNPHKAMAEMTLLRTMAVYKIAMVPNIYACK